MYRLLLASAALLALPLAPTASAQITVVSAASFQEQPGVAPDSIASAFGQGLAPATVVAEVLPLPTSLGGVSLVLTDSAGAEHECQLFFVSPGQINFLVPGDAALGEGTVAVRSGAGLSVEQSLSGTIVIVRVAPALFFQGESLAAAQILRVKADGTQIIEPTLERNAQGEIVPRMIEMSPGGDESDQIYLIAFGTGFRGHPGLGSVQSFASSGIIVPEFHAIETLFLGAQGAFAGLDQGNLGPLARTLEWTGGGLRVFRIDVDGLPSNEVYFGVAPNPNAPVLTNLRARQQTLAEGFALFVDVDFQDADADLNAPTISLILEDDRRLCIIPGRISDGRVAGQSQGTLSFGFLQQGLVLFLGEITNVTLSIGDSGMHVSNIAEFMPAAGTLGNERFACADVVRKEDPAAQALHWTRPSGSRLEALR